MEAADRTGKSQAEAWPLEPLLSISEVREVLRISESGVYRLMKSGELPAVRLGGRTLFSPDVVRALIAARTESGVESDLTLEDSR